MLLKCSIEISCAKTSSKWLRKWAMATWEVANGKISFLLFTSWYTIINSYGSMKLARNNPFRLYLMEKNNWLENANGTIFGLK